MSRAHFYRPMQDNLGNIVAGGSVMLYDPSTGSPFAGEVFSDAAATNLLSLPWVSVNGIVDFYMDVPQYVTIGYTPVGGAEILFPVQAVMSPRYYVLTPTFTNLGVLATFTGDLPIYVEDDMFIEKIRASVGVTPEGSEVIVDIKVDGVSVFTDIAHLPTLNPGDTTVAVAPDLPVILSGQAFTMDIAQVGSTIPGSDLVVQIWAHQQTPHGTV